MVCWFILASESCVVISESSAHLIHLTLLGMIYESMAPHTLMFGGFSIRDCTSNSGFSPWSSMVFVDSSDFFWLHTSNIMQHQPANCFINIPMFFVKYRLFLVTSIASSPHFLQLKSSMHQILGFWKSTLVIPHEVRPGVLWTSIGAYTTNLWIKLGLTRPFYMNKLNKYMNWAFILWIN